MVGGSYYGLTLAAGHMGTSIYLGTALSGLVELPAVLAIFYAIEAHGRKLAVVTFLSLGGLFCLRLELRITLCFASSHNKEQNICSIKIMPESATTILALCGKLCIAGAFKVFEDIFTNLKPKT